MCRLFFVARLLSSMHRFSRPSVMWWWWWSGGESGEEGARHDQAEDSEVRGFPVFRFQGCGSRHMHLHVRAKRDLRVYAPRPQAWVPSDSWLFRVLLTFTLLYT